MFDESLGGLDQLAALLRSDRSPDALGWIEPYVEHVMQGVDGAALAPYPTATRLFNGLRSAAVLLAEGHERSARALRRMALRDLRWLRLRLERHNRANHLLHEVAACRLAEAVFGRPGRLATHLDRIVAAQFLPDGGHVERSPSYGLRCLRDLVEVRRALGNDAVALPTLVGALGHLRTLHLGDGLPLLGDSEAMPVPDLATVIEAAALPHRIAPAAGPTWFPNSGLQVVRRAESVLVLRSGRPPKSTTAHVHADQGAITWSLDGRRVLGALGTSTYAPGSERDRTRSARAHSAIVLAQPQMEWLGPFRLGDRGHGERVSVEDGLGARVTWPDGTTVERTVRLDGRSLQVVDRSHTPGGEALFHVPDAKIVDGVALQGDRVVEIEGALLEPSHWYPSVGERRPAVTARVRLVGPTTTRIRVRPARGPRDRTRSAPA